MAASRRPGSIGLGLVERVSPARTPGPLGLFDQGDPDLATLLGDTPGPLGFNDWADQTLGRSGSLGMPSLGGIGSSPDGAALSLGALHAAALTTPAATAGELALARAQEMALQITTVFEGGTSMNYKALAGDFDGQGTSFGLIQWNFGQNTLGPLLKLMLAADATAFAGCFGDHADYATLKKALDANKQADQLAWARALQKNNKAAWTAAFTALGGVGVFNRIQREQAAAKYHPIVVGDIANLRTLSADLLKKVEFRSYAALFDMAVQQNGIAKAADEIALRVASEKPATQLALMTIAVSERGAKASSAWQSDCISRRMGILQGAAYESTLHKVTKKRGNPQFALVTDNGTKEVSGL